MLRLPKLDPDLDQPLYRQLFDFFHEEILAGRLPPGEKIPPTRELALRLGLNRMTISSAYELLESEGLIRTHVGRGSFVAAPPELFADGPMASSSSSFDWEKRFAPGLPNEAAALAAAETTISFSSARPSAELFPIVAFQESCREVLLSPEVASILQLGSAHGYPPLRRHLIAESRSRGLMTQGFWMKSRAPRRMASTARSTLPQAVITITGSVLSRDCSRLSRSRPSWPEVVSRV